MISPLKFPCAGQCEAALPAPPCRADGIGRMKRSAFREFCTHAAPIAPMPPAGALAMGFALARRRVGTGTQYRNTDDGRAQAAAPTHFQYDGIHDFDKCRYSARPHHIHLPTCAMRRQLSAQPPPADAANIGSFLLRPIAARKRTRKSAMPFASASADARRHTTR